MLCGHKVKLLTTLAEVRRCLSHDHFTVYVWELLSGEMCPPFFVFKGDSIACVPQCILDGATRNECWYWYSGSGNVEDETFVHFRRLYCDWKVKRFGKDAPVIDIFDNHTAHLEPRQLLMAAQHNVTCCAGPSGLTHAWQVNDDILNRTIHDLISAELETLAELKFVCVSLGRRRSLSL
jgi:hypothetical protein